MSKQQHQHLNIWQQAHCSSEIDDCSSLVEYFIFAAASRLNGKEEKKSSVRFHLMTHIINLNDLSKEKHFNFILL